MAETDAPTTLAERALARLRKLASGNGLQPAAIDLLEKQEQVFALEGRMEVSPLCETRAITYAGGVRGKDRKQARDAQELRAAVARHQKSFTEDGGWLAAVRDEIRAHETQGFGLEDARVTLPEKSAIYAATETCPSCGGRKLLTCTQCLGQGEVVCTQCQGQGREPCYYCAGRGEDPHNPGQPCPTCRGTRFAPCRFCHSRGRLVCPTCQGKRGTPCPACNATGAITQEVTVECGAQTHFKLIAAGLPSGLRRGLERIGIANLGKGHADIAVTPPDADDTRDKPPFPILSYRAALPYAELRVSFGDKRKGVVTAVGKRCVISGVPPFLDDTLKPWREKLSRAAAGKGPLEAALEARALKETLALTVAGKGSIEALRKIYPFGLSGEAMTAMLADMRLAVNKVTLKTRSLIAAGCAGLCGALFYGWFDLGLRLRGAGAWDAEGEAAPGAALDFALFGALLVASWGMLAVAVQFALKRRFPHLAVTLQQKIGKTGYTMLAGIAALFALCVFFAPLRPLWLALLLTR